MGGSWSNCDVRGVERRYANDGQLYTEKEFQAYYGAAGRIKWTESKPYVERRMEKNGRAYYTAAEFRAYYINSYGEKGWVYRWELAQQEQRKAMDGKWYFFQDFIRYYGAD